MKKIFRKKPRWKKRRGGTNRELIKSKEVVVKKCPPGYALGCHDLQHWSSRRLTSQ